MITSHLNSAGDTPEADFRALIADIFEKRDMVSLYNDAPRNGLYVRFCMIEDYRQGIIHKTPLPFSTKDAEKFVNINTFTLHTIAFMVIEDRMNHTDAEFQRQNEEARKIQVDLGHISANSRFLI